MLERIPPYKSLDHWRGFAALWVVMLHACLPVIDTTYTGLAQSPLYAFSLLGQLGVPIFFVISGYCIANAAYKDRAKNAPMAGYAQARVRRIYPPYWITALCAVAMATAMKRLFPGGAWASNEVFGRPPLYYFSTLTLTQFVFDQPLLLPVFWTLCYEVAFYLVVGLVMWATLRARSGETMLYALHAVTVAALLWMIAVPRSVPFPFGLWPHFGLGVLVFHLVAGGGRKVLAVSVAVLTLFVAYAARNDAPNLHDGPTARTQFLFCAAFATVLYLLHRYDERIMALKAIRPIAALGVFSYSVYLTHLFYTGIVWRVGQRLGTTQNTYILVFLLQIAVCIGLGYVFHLIAERPFMGKARKKDAPQPT